MTRRARTLTRAIFPLVLLAATTWLATPGSADTKGELDSAKARVAALQDELDRATAAYEAAHDKYIRTTAQIHATTDEIASTRDRMTRIQAALSKRARSAYESGPGGALDILLSSGTLGEFSDRVEFLGAVQRSDSSLIAQAAVTAEQLRREEHDLSLLANEQEAAAASLQREQTNVSSKLDETQSLVAELTKQLEAEQRARTQLNLYNQAVPVTISSGGALATCPVAGPHSYVDSFGAPRSGGRTHQGDDIMAPRGVPVVAAQSGNAVQDPNDLGGNAVIVYATNGDYTYYAHLDSYGASGSVSAGTQIGTVGNTGNAAGGPTHLHFEYHPGGGDAVDPTPYLDAVC